ncbi:hypothetical protein GpartN1_g4751.t1 [Galdieria partita]|uniref:Adenylyl-sulfate kinase n=1 Tax=Galdieria partita TaxID=83374 RepID=A0A9C7PYU5_9RHOD|nr:hypothetical protein GpartN1_g4751.t1 [Galdieria partita]
MSHQRCLRYELLGQRGLTLWFTGLSASGKSTICYSLENKLLEERRLCYCLDGDVMRKGINSDLGYTNNDRTENIRRLGEIATILTDMGAITLVAAITPFQKDRSNIKRMHERKRLPFWEVFIDCPLAICEKRDPKSLYAKARNGEIQQFTGIDSPYETPEHPDITLHTANSTIEECVQFLLTKIHCFLSSSNEANYKKTEILSSFIHE